MLAGDPVVSYLGHGVWRVDDVVGSWHACHTHLTRQHGMRHSEANTALVHGHRQWAADQLHELLNDPRGGR
ncbi:hypothetical protein [Nocardiopsis sp. FIRDI 009]|uniref:hypothetical protein n=1 Tax=Nocardiopsis sp. FIRDI 009 TaxID=714197 RepID=UPI000E2641D6|nr:hypothetical protein [Nocardiopsis sp. FIRDI 009]